MYDENNFIPYFIGHIITYPCRQFIFRWTTIERRWMPTPEFGSNYITITLYHIPLLWRHNGRDGVSNDQPRDCLLNRSFRSRTKEASKLRVTGHCVGNSPVTGEFPTQMASNAGNLSIWWRHYATLSQETMTVTLFLFMHFWRYLILFTHLLTKAGHPIYL